MGRQINFFMLPEDEEAFVDVARASDDVVVLAERSTSAEPRIIDALPDQGTAAAREGVVLWNRRVSPLPPMKEVAPGRFLVDKANAEVVELVQCELVGDTLRCGRLWVEPRLYGNDAHPTQKGDAFLKWYDAMAKWIRSHFQRHDQSYVGPAAQVWAKERGGKFE